MGNFKMSVASKSEPINDAQWDSILENVGFHEAHRQKIVANLRLNGIQTPARLKVALNQRGSDNLDIQINIIHTVISSGIPPWMREDDRVWRSRLKELEKMLP